MPQVVTVSIILSKTSHFVILICLMSDDNTCQGRASGYLSAHLSFLTLSLPDWPNLSPLLVSIHDTILLVKREPLGGKGLSSECGSHEHLPCKSD